MESRSRAAAGWSFNVEHGLNAFFSEVILYVYYRTEEQLKFHRKRGQWPPKHHVRDNISMGRNYAPFYRKKYHH